MAELIRRLFSNQRLATLLLVVSLIANLLALASPIFVMLVLGRYIAHGIDATLITLSIGVVLAITMEYVFRNLRLRLARKVSLQSDKNLAIGSLGVIASCPVQELGQANSNQHLQAQRDLDNVTSAFNASNLCSVLDVPFALLFLLVLFLLNVALGFVATAFILIVFLLRKISSSLQHATQLDLSQASNTTNAHFANLVRSPDAVRLFDPTGWLMKKWAHDSSKLGTLRTKMVQSQGITELSVASLQVLLGSTIIAVGASFVVTGDLNVSALIGANILAARAFAPVSRLSQLTSVFEKAEASLSNLRSLANSSKIEGQTTPVHPCKGALELRDVSFTHPGMPLPLYEKLSQDIPAGSVVLIKGSNGVGKSTLMRLVLGLLPPDRGQIFADGMDIRQLAPSWWRDQVGYLPQEPWFFDASVKENLLVANPNLTQAATNQIIEQSGLRGFIEENPQGLDMALTGGGANLSLGIRKRLALARLLTKPAPIVLLDEPVEGMDDAGRKVITSVLDQLSRQRRTTVIATNDPELARRAHIVLDLDNQNTANLHLASPIMQSPAGGA